MAVRRFPVADRRGRDLAVALTVAALLPLGALASPVLQQTANLRSSLSSFTYQDSGTTGVVTYVNRVAQNTGLTSEHSRRRNLAAVGQQHADLS